MSRYKKSQVNNLTLQLKELEKEEQKQPKVRREKIIKIRTELNEIAKRLYKKVMQRIAGSLIRLIKLTNPW